MCSQQTWRSTLLSDSEITQKSIDSLLLIGARVRDSILRTFYQRENRIWFPRGPLPSTSIIFHSLPMSWQRLTAHAAPSFSASRLQTICDMILSGKFQETSADCPRISYSRYHQININAISPPKKTIGSIASCLYVVEISPTIPSLNSSVQLCAIEITACLWFHCGLFTYSSNEFTVYKMWETQSSDGWKWWW